MFKLEKLPKRIIEKLHSIEWVDEPEIIGIAYLKNEYEFADGSHCFGFTSRSDLIDFIDEEAEPAKPRILFKKNGDAEFCYGDCGYVGTKHTVKEIEDYIKKLNWEEYDAQWE